MNNKAFSLIELIATIVLLSLAVLIMTKLVDVTIKKGQIKAEEVFKQNIELAASNWASDNRTDAKERKKVFLKELQEEGYIDEDIVSPKSKKVDSEKTCVQIDGDSYKEYIYKYKEDCTKEDNND